jgi:hypothetical protein
VVDDGSTSTGVRGHAADAPRMVGCDPAGVASEKGAVVPSDGGGSGSGNISAARSSGSPRATRETFPNSRDPTAEIGARRARAFPRLARP